MGRTFDWAGRSDGDREMADCEGHGYVADLEFPINNLPFAPSSLFQPQMRLPSNEFCRSVSAPFLIGMCEGGRRS